jgi:hypothetical protein
MNVSRRDDRTQPGVLTPGYRCRKRPALKGQKIVAAEIELGSIHGGRISDPSSPQNNFRRRIQNLLEKNGVAVNE